MTILTNDLDVSPLIIRFYVFCTSIIGLINSQHYNLCLKIRDDLMLALLAIGHKRGLMQRRCWQKKTLSLIIKYMQTRQYLRFLHVHWVFLGEVNWEKEPNLDLSMNKILPNFSVISQDQSSRAIKKSNYLLGQS